MIREKEEKKLEQERAKEEEKIERELKRQQWEAEKKKKEEERKLKALERQKKKAELEEVRKQKAAEREAKRRKKSEVTKVFVTRSKSSKNTGYSPQHSESGVNECTACFGYYCDDISEDGNPTRDWIQCTNGQCKKWMHEDCIKDDDGTMTCVCGTTLVW